MAPLVNAPSPVCRQRHGPRCETGGRGHRRRRLPVRGAQARAIAPNLWAEEIEAALAARLGESTSMRVAIYARVSTKQQENAMQVTDLRNYAARQRWEAILYLEKASSVKHRPVFEQLLRDAQAGKVSVILVWRIDRFARSMRDFVNVTLQLATWKVRLVSVTEAVDSGNENPFARFMLGLLALLAELERNIIVERVRAGVAEAKRQGKHCGRPRRVFRRDEAARLRAGGMSWRAIERKLGVPQATIRLALRGVQKV